MPGGYRLGADDAARFLGPLAEKVPREKHAALLADAWAHAAAYTGGFLGASFCGLGRGGSEGEFSVSRPSYSSTPRPADSHAAWAGGLLVAAASPLGYSRH